MGKGTKAEEGVNSEGKENDASLEEGSEVVSRGDQRFCCELRPGRRVMSLEKRGSLGGRLGTRRGEKAGDSDINGKEGGGRGSGRFDSIGLKGNANISWALVGEALGVKKRGSFTGDPMFGVGEASKGSKVGGNMEEGVPDAITETLLTVGTTAEEVVAKWVKGLVAVGAGVLGGR